MHCLEIFSTCKKYSTVQYSMLGTLNSLLLCPKVYMWNTKYPNLYGILLYVLKFSYSFCILLRINVFTLIFFNVFNGFNKAGLHFCFSCDFKILIKILITFLHDNK